MRCPRPQKLDGARLCTSTQEKFKSSRSPSSPSYHLIRSNQVPASGNATVFDILHTLGTSCRALHRAIAHTLARLRVRDFRTHLMSLRYIVAGTAVVRAPSDTRPPRPPTTSAPSCHLLTTPQHHLPIVASGCRCVLCPRRVQSLRGRVGGDRGRDRAQRTQRQDQVGKT